MKRILAYSLLAVLLLSIVSYGGTPSKDPWATSITVTFKDTPLRQAVDTLLKPAGISYAFGRLADEGQRYKITAVFRNVSIEAALAQTLKAVNCSYTKTGVVVNITDNSVESVINNAIVAQSIVSNDFANQQQFSGTSNQISPYQIYAGNQRQNVVGANSFSQMNSAGIFVPDEWGRDESEIIPQHPEYKTYETLTLRYLDASAVLPLASLEPNLLVAKTGARALTVHARPAAIERFKNVVALVDRQESLPRVLRIAVKGCISLTDFPSIGIGSEPKTFLLDTEIMTVDGMAGSSKVTAAAAWVVPDKEGNSLSVSVIPTILDAYTGDNSTTISLYGNGIIGSSAPQFSRMFDILASVRPKEEINVLSSNLETVLGKVAFSVTLSADIEPGRVQLPAMLQNARPLDQSRQTINIQRPAPAPQPSPK